MFVLLALAVALFIFVMGAWGVFAPGSIFAFISGWSSKNGFWLAVLLRLCFGLALWFAAPDTRLPIVLRALGALAIVMAMEHRTSKAPMPGDIRNLDTDFAVEFLMRWKIREERDIMGSFRVLRITSRHRQVA